MSMHEIEDLVHLSVMALDRHHPAGDGRVRDWLVALYEFQRGFDCSHTQGRVEDILIRRRHTYRFPVGAHPDYPERRAFFDGITEFTELRETDDEHQDDSLEDGYVDPPWLYCEAGTALWRRMVDDEPPRAVKPIDLAAAVAEAAEAQGDVDLIAGWYALGHQTLVGGAVFSVEELAEMPAVAALRAIVVRTGAMSVELPPGYRPSEEELEMLDDELESWWYAVSVSA
ncbi:hypothetical protein ACQP2X_48575 [Actinoplanes sp. CA-131856]